MPFRCTYDIKNINDKIKIISEKELKEKDINKEIESNLKILKDKKKYSKNIFLKYELVL